MFLFCLRKDQNVVQVHYYDPFGYEGPEDVVHHSLEGGGTVGHSKEHHKRFEEAVVGVEGCFLLGNHSEAIALKLMESSRS